MEKVMNINEFISNLPKIQEKKVWKVVDANGTVVQYVGATDNRMTTAQRYIDSKYPERNLALIFSHYKNS